MATHLKFEKKLSGYVPTYVPLRIINFRDFQGW